MNTISYKGSDLIISYTVFNGVVSASLNNGGGGFSAPHELRQLPMQMYEALIDAGLSPETIDTTACCLFSLHITNYIIDPKTSDTVTMCQAKIKDSGMCSRYALYGTNFCQQHANWTPPQPAPEPQLCQAITAAGKKCSRNANDGGVYCTQHVSQLTKPVTTPRVCIAITVKGIKCSNHAKVGDYCGVHAKLANPIQFLHVKKIKGTFNVDGQVYNADLSKNTVAQLDTLAKLTNLDTRGFLKDQYITALARVIYFM